MRDPHAIRQTSMPWERIYATHSCWFWLGNVCPAGYGNKICINGSWDKPHRHMYRLMKGEIPAGLFVMHSCDTPQCVNPEHLSLGTALDNVRDMIRKGRFNAHNRYTTHCPHGHLYSPENTYIATNGGRVCRTCAGVRRMNARLARLQAETAQQAIHSDAAPITEAQ